LAKSSGNTLDSIILPSFSLRKMEHCPIQTSFLKSLKGMGKPFIFASLTLRSISFLWFSKWVPFIINGPPGRLKGKTDSVRTALEVRGSYLGCIFHQRVPQRGYKPRLI